MVQNAFLAPRFSRKVSQKKKFGGKMVKGPHQEGRLPLGGGSLKYVIPNIDIWALIEGKFTLVLLVPLRLKKNLLEDTIHVWYEVEEASADEDSAGKAG